VTTKIEEALKTVSGIDRIASISSENFANIEIEVYTNQDVDQMLTQVKNAVDGVNGLPIGVEHPPCLPDWPSRGTRSMASLRRQPGRSRIACPGGAFPRHA
jgi:multidrug efflux pump subunit AcrB